MAGQFLKLIEHAVLNGGFPPEYLQDIQRPSEFPQFVRQLPRADYSNDGADAIRGYVLLGAAFQVVFNENDDEVEFEPHRHAQSFGIVLQGTCELVIDGISTTYHAGEVYHVPGGVLHHAKQSAGYRDIVIFAEPCRVPVRSDTDALR